jgi:hypothetical protein
MSVFRTALTENERQVVNAERDSHPAAHVRRKTLVAWLLHCGLTRQKTAEIAGLRCPIIQRYVDRDSQAGSGSERRGHAWPLSLVRLTNLSSNATLANATGTDAQANPYIDFVSPSGQLAVGQSITVTLYFKDPTFKAITYDTLVGQGL